MLVLQIRENNFPERNFCKQYAKISSREIKFPYCYQRIEILAKDDNGKIYVYIQDVSFGHPVSS